MSTSIARDLVLTETEVRAVLERAVLIEAKNGALSVQELERIATEAGISTGALRAALREILEARDLPAPAQPAVHVPDPTASTRSPQIGYAYRIIICAAIGLGAGEFAASGIGEAMLGAGVLLAGAIQRAFRHRSTDTPGEFQTELLAAWSMYSIGFGIGNNIGLTEDIMFEVGSMYALSACIGGVISASKRITWRPWKRSIDVDGEPRNVRV